MIGGNKLNIYIRIRAVRLKNSHNVLLDDVLVSRSIPGNTNRNEDEGKISVEKYAVF